MQIALRKVTKHFHRKLLPALTTRTPLTNLMLPRWGELRGTNWERLGLMRRMYYGFVSIAVPFKFGRSKAGV